MKDKQARWLALYVLCLGDLMIVLDTNIVNVALPSIQADLGFSQTALAWVVNAYMLTFGGFLLLSGRLGDLFGNKRVFLAGVVSFTSASIACGFAPNPLFLVIGRAVQGLGGAAVSAVALALIMGLFTLQWGLMADLIASNRKLLEDLLYRVRKLELPDDRHG